MTIIRFFYLEVALPPLPPTIDNNNRLMSSLFPPKAVMVVVMVVGVSVSIATGSWW